MYGELFFSVGLRVLFRALMIVLIFCRGYIVANIGATVQRVYDTFCERTVADVIIEGLLDLSRCRLGADMLWRCL